MKKGEMVLIEYVGRIKSTGQIFDLTSEELAKKEGLYDPRLKYGPVAVIVGAGHVIRGVDKALEHMKEGEKKTFVIKPSDGFGERDPRLVKTMSEKTFKKEGITPVPGMELSSSLGRMRILSVNSGRVKVDLNHPLAGKELEYEIEIKKRVTDPVEKLSRLVGFHTGLDEKHYNARTQGKKGIVEVDIELPEGVKKIIEEEAREYLGLESVEFVACGKEEKQGGSENKGKTKKTTKKE